MSWLGKLGPRVQIPPSPLQPAPLALTRTVRLRPWQQAALEQFAACDNSDFLAEATPGAGKTTFALTAAVRVLSSPGGPRRLVVVVPSSHLKRQWAEAAVAFGIHLDPSWAPADGRLPADMHGIVTSYQQVASSAEVLRHLSLGALVIFDEIHHAGDDRAWGASVRRAFESAPRRLALSGTPFRSDTRAIPFVIYDNDVARPDFAYGYGEALAAGRVVRPIFFPRTNGHMEWSAPDGSEHSATFDDPLATVRANQRLRTALSVEGEWLPAVLQSAHERLTIIRQSHPEAGGLIIATDQDHAKGIAGLLMRRLGVRATIATSDDPAASGRIARFSTSLDPWLVAVRMVSEGVDIPRLRVGVYATTTTTELFFRQAVGRFVRWTPGVPAQRSYLWIPDDIRLRTQAFQIADVRRHSLRKEGRPEAPEDGDAFDDVRDAEAALTGPPGEQLSLFGVISAVATETEMHEVTLSPLATPATKDDGYENDLEAQPLSLLSDIAVESFHAEEEISRVKDDGWQSPLTRKEHKGRLREANAALARSLVHLTGTGHAEVNAELNRMAGIRRVTEATVEQLERRIRQGEHWYTRLSASKG